MSDDRREKAARARTESWLMGLTVVAFEQANLLRTLTRHPPGAKLSIADVEFVHQDVLRFFEANLPKDVVRKLREVSAGFLRQLASQFAADDAEKS